MRFKILIFILSAFFVSSCSDTVLNKPYQKGVNISSAGNFCTQSPDDSMMYTKFLFIIDKSGSNVQGNNGNPPTDPNNVRRADNIEAFYQKHAANKYIKWGYIAFQDTGAKGGHAYIGTDDNPIFSGIPADMETAIILQRTNPDSGGTPYKAAFAMARLAIKNDIQNHPEEDSHYMVFFMSDGYPTDYDVFGPPGQAAFKDVDDVMNLLPGKINVSTAYYGPPDAGASNGLREMGEVHGKGKFVDLNQQSDFDLDDLLVGGVTAETYVIKPESFVVYNVNSAICFDNAYGMDSDGDGLCDVDEKTLGYNPQNRFSFNDGYSDYFHYFSVKFHANLFPCTDRSDVDNDLLTVCEETFLLNSTPSGTKRTNGDPLNPDTDRDSIIDGLEFFTLFDKSSPMDAFNLLKNYDTESTKAAEQIRQHRNPKFPDSKLPKEEVYDVKLDPTGTNLAGQSCYHYSQSVMKVYPTLPIASGNALNDQYLHGKNGNVILISYIQTLQKDPNGPGVYAYSIQTVDNGNPKSGLQINDRAFKLYKVPAIPQ